MKNIDVILKPGKEAPLNRGHLWVFSGAVQRVTATPLEGELVCVRSASGDVMGWGQWHGQASISVRMLSVQEQAPDDHFFTNALSNCIAKRKAAGLPNAQTNAYRLVHGEGDLLPGLVVDVYHQHVVMQCHTTGMWLIKEMLAQAIDQLLAPQTIVAMDERSGNREAAEYFKGDAAAAEILEYGNRFAVNWIEGQKTGFFIDQRENRMLLQHMAAGKKVLNAFSYTAGFSVSALAGGATHVDSVDVSQKAIDMANSNIALNGFEARHRGITADVMQYLNDMDADYDVVILDPPAFAKRKDARHKAVMGYKNLNFKALRKMKSGSLLFTFSCSQVVDKDLFRGAIMAAGIDAGRQLSILHQLHQPADHPVNLYQPETEYLKGLVLYVE